MVGPGALTPPSRVLRVPETAAPGPCAERDSSPGQRFTCHFQHLETARPTNPHQTGAGVGCSPQRGLCQGWGLPTPFTTHAHTVSSSEDMLSVASLLNFANDTVMIFQNEK